MIGKVDIISHSTPISFDVLLHMSRTAERGGRRGHCPGARGHRGTRSSELSGLECKLHQLKLRPAGAMMLFFDFGPKFEHPRTL